MTIYLRADRAVFRFSGPDAHKLLNDVVTGRIPATGTGEGEVAAAWALLSPQGKILAEGLAGHAADAIWVDVHQSVADDFFKRMKMYRLRASVTIDDLRASHRVGFARDEEPGGIRHTDRMGPIDMGWRTIAPPEATAGWVQDDGFYQAERIGLGIAHQGNDFPANDAFAHDIGMDILDGIDFAKGCYVGQEVVSRMQHRGTARTRVVPVAFPDFAPMEGLDIMAGEKTIGMMGSAANGRGLAKLRLDRVADALAAGEAITAGGIALTPVKPDWARCDWPGEAAEG